MIRPGEAPGQGKSISPCNFLASHSFLLPRDIKLAGIAGWCVSVFPSHRAVSGIMEGGGGGGKVGPDILRVELCYAPLTAPLTLCCNFWPDIIHEL